MAAKKCNRTLQHFYRYFCRSLAQAGQQTEDGNLKTELQSGLSLHLHLLLGMVSTGWAQNQHHGRGIGLGPSRAGALMFLEGQTLMALHGVEPDYPRGPLNGSL